MTDEEILKILKADLQISAGLLDEYLKTLIASAKKYITREGIDLTESVDDALLVEMYAAYLYRKRREDVPMPKMLRWNLNNRLFSQKAKE